MKSPTRTLRGRLFFSHLAVVAIGVAVLLVAGPRLGTFFVDDHLRSMGSMMGGGMTQEFSVTLEEGITVAFNRALLWAAAASSLAAIAAATFSARRMLRPLDEVRRVARRLASGSYGERVPEPAVFELAALATDVNLMAEALQATEQRRVRLVGEVAHELRTPIATLTGYLEGLIDGVFEPDQETLVAAAREAARMERLAADLSSLSSAEEGRVELRVAPIDLAELVTEVVERLRPQFVDQGVRLEQGPTDSAEVVVDRDRISQVLTNLIGNALSYTYPGGHVRISTHGGPGSSRVVVADTGRGLSEEQLPMVFERFYRADRSAPGGTGIGLTIARSLARLHGGDLTVTSPGIGLGSTFELTLPTLPSGG